MKKNYLIFLILFSSTITICCNKKQKSVFDNKILKGKWVYRSLNNYPLDTPFCHLEFATAIMKISTISNDSIFGILEMGEGAALNLKGKIIPCDTICSFYIRGLGIPNSSTDNWEYDYQGYLIPKWKSGINQIEACVGSVLRAKPHGSSKAGKTASFYMIKQP